MKRKRRKTRIKINWKRFVLFIAAAVILAAVIFWGVGAFMNSEEEIEKIPEPEQQEMQPVTVNATADDLVSAYGGLYRLEDGECLFEFNSRERMFPASMTKIMTALTVIESLNDLDKEILVPREIFQPLEAAHASMAGFLPDEKVKARDLLYGCLLSSGADASISLAIDIAGSEEEFVHLMNQKAEELGMADTNFVNVTGLHDDNHYTTVEDTAVLLSYALQNDIFYNAFNAHCYFVKNADLHPEGMILRSVMFYRLETNLLDNGRILGGKTGYTGPAGLCLASLAEVDDEKYILVTAGAEGNNYTPPYHVEDAAAVYNSIRR